jgi:hypothetical protein
LLERDERLLVADLAAVGLGIRRPVEHLPDLRLRHVVVRLAARVGGAPAGCMTTPECDAEPVTGWVKVG